MTSSPGPNGELTVRVLRGPQDLVAIGRDWDDLMGRARDASPFLARAWTEVWITAGRTRGAPVGVTAWCGERLVALLAVEIRAVAGVRVAQAIGSEHTGYHGLLLDSDCPQAAERIAEACAAGGLFHVLRLSDTAATDQATELLLRALSKRRFVIARAHRNPCRTIALGCAYDDYLKRTKSKKSRYNLRAEDRRLREGAAVQIAHFSGADITAQLVDRSAQVQAASWMMRRGAAVLSDEFFRRVAVSAGREGLGHLWLVTIDGEDAAFGYGLLAHGRFHYVWTAFRLRYAPMSVGKVLMGSIIRDVCALGAVSFDFGHGDAEYKRFWATDSHDVDRVVAGRAPLGIPIVLAHEVAWRLAKIGWLRSVYRTLRRHHEAPTTQTSQPEERGSAPSDSESGSPGPN